MQEVDYIHVCTRPFAVLDEELRLVANNDAWNRISASQPFPGWQCRTGESYLGACHEACGVEPEHARRIRDALCQIREGSIAQSAIRYTLRTTSGPQAFTVNIVRPPGQYVLVTHVEAEFAPGSDAARTLGCIPREVTEQVRRETQLLQRAERLEDAIGRATRELTRINAGRGIDTASPQETLERFSALLSGMVEHSPVATVIFAPDGTALWANEACRRLFAIDPEVPLGGHNLFDDPVLSPHAAEMRRCLVDGARVEIEADYPLARLPVRCSDRQRVLRLKSTMFPVRNEAGQVFCALVQHEDMTARLAAEEEARQQQAMLAHTLRVATITELASILAHEVNQPLSAIINFARGCIHRLAPDRRAGSELLQTLERIVGEAERAGAILRQVRTFIRKEPPRRSPEDLNTVIREAAQIIDLDAARHGISVSYELGENLPQVLINKTQVQQVVLNLALNAIEAMSGCQERRLLILTSGSEQGAQVSVADSGPGLAPEVEQRLFEPFFTSRPEGLGMGLAISRSIIESHGGKLWSERRTGHGATFLFSLPRPGEPAHAAR